MSALNALISLLIASCSYFGKTHCPGYVVPLARFGGYFVNQGTVIVGSVFGVYGECICDLGAQEICQSSYLEIRVIASLME